MKHAKVFIVSSGRAGSTLLQSMLNSGQQIYIPPESDFIARAYPFFSRKNDFTEFDYETLASIFCKTSQNSGWGMDKNQIITYLNASQPKSFADVFARICEAFHKKEGTQDLTWGIKRPVLIASLDRIFSTYPDAKIIHICRDGRDVYLSYKAVHENGSRTFGPKGVLTNALYWIDGLRRIEDCKRRGYDKRIFELKYEDLVKDPEIVLRGICSFLGLSYQSAMINDFNDKTKRGCHKFCV